MCAAFPTEIGLQVVRAYQPPLELGRDNDRHRRDPGALEVTTRKRRTVRVSLARRDYVAEKYEEIRVVPVFDRTEHDDVA